MDDDLNPFRNQSALNQAVAYDVLAEICLHSCLDRAAAWVPFGDPSIDKEIAETRTAVRRNRSDAWPLHPNVIRQRFRHVTTSVLEGIAALYSDQIARPIWAVNEILDGLARAAAIEPLDPVAIWVLCTHFSAQRTRCIAAQVETTNADWCVIQLQLPVTVSSKTDGCFNAALTLVIDDESHQVISFRVAPAESIGEVALCLYEAICLRRVPCAENRRGLRWLLPRRILVNAGPMVGPLQQLCADFPFRVTDKASPSSAVTEELFTAVTGNWHHSLGTRTLLLGHFEQIFDNYLWRFHGFGPRRARTERARQYAHLAGYSEDPAVVYPTLRHLLPKHDGCIEDGIVRADGLDYQHHLLKMWPARRVSLVQSQTAEAHAWIYFGDHVICRASALQLRRRDGTYRPNRERR